MKLDTLDALNDAELQAVIARAEELLKTRDEERKASALADASATLAAVGLTLRDLVKGKSKTKAGKTPIYHAGHQYQHPTNKALIWNAKGQKPHWLRHGEAKGGRPIELGPEAANDNVPPSIRKTG